MKLRSALLLAPTCLLVAAKPAPPSAIQVLEAHAKATGGDQAWKGLNALSLTYRIQVNGEDAGTEEVLLLPNPYRLVRVVHQEGRQVDVFSQGGKNAARVTQQGQPGSWFSMPFSPVDHDPRWHQALGWEYEALPDEMVEGRRCHVLRRRCPEANLSWFDAATGLLVCRREGTFQVIRSYRSVEGLKVPEVIDLDEFGALRRLTLVTVDRKASLEGRTTTFPALPPTPDATPKVYAEGESVPEALRIRTLETAWKLVNDRFFDPSFQGVDWAAMKARYLPQAKEAPTAKALHDVVSAMLREVKTSHMALLPAGFTASNGGGGALGGTLGLQTRLQEDRVWITGFTEPAAQRPEGPRPGEELVALEGVSLKDRLASLRAGAGEGKGASDLLKQLGLAGFLKRASDPALAKPIGETLSARVRDAKGQEREVRLPVLRPQGEERPFDLEWRGDTAILRVRNFTGSFLLQLQEALPRLRAAKGVILDLRGNGGGFDGQARKLGGCFLDKEVGFTRTTSRKGTETRTLTPWGGDPIKAPLAILVDGRSGSTTECLAAALQECGRATILGERSAGGVLPSALGTLPTGAKLQIAIADAWTPKGVRLEGVGVTPDVEVRPAGDGRDTALEAALKHLG